MVVKIEKIFVDINCWMVMGRESGLGRGKQGFHANIRRVAR